jgi:hypothetical protein
LPELADIELKRLLSTTVLVPHGEYFVLLASSGCTLAVRLLACAPYRWNNAAAADMGTVA